MCFSLLSGDWEHSVVKQSSRSSSASTLRQPASFCCSSSSSSRFRRTWADMVTPQESELKPTGLGQQSSPHGPSESLRPGCASCRVVPSSVLLAAASSLAPGEHSRHFEPPGCRRVSATGAAVAQCPLSTVQPTRSAVLCRPQRLLIPQNQGFASWEIGTSPQMGRRLAQLSLATAAEAVAAAPCSSSRWWSVSSGTRPGAPARTRPLPQAPKTPRGRAAWD